MIRAFSKSISINIILSRMTNNNNLPYLFITGKQTLQRIIIYFLKVYSEVKTINLQYIFKKVNSEVKTINLHNNMVNNNKKKII